MDKQVWSYWEGPRTSLIDLCLASWDKHLVRSGWSVVVLTPETLDNYNIIKPKSFDSLTPTTKSDVVRLSVLYTHGGLWLDASVYLTSNVDWLLSTNNSICGVRYNQYEYIESWVLYSRPRNPHVLLWLQTLNAILDTDPVTEHMVYAAPCVSNPTYFMIYQAFCFLRKEHADFDTIFRTCEHVNTFDVFWFGFVPLDKERRLVKFTSQGRDAYPFVRFPWVYMYILVFLVL